MKQISKADVPKFSALEDFAAWYVESGFPRLAPERTEVFLSDDATATCLFRCGRFQVEMYMIHPNPVVPLHEHPGVENIEIPDFLGTHISKERLASLVQKSGEAHGDTIRQRAESAGYPLLSIQRWDDGITMSTIGARWKGNTAGPKHEALIRRFNPNALVYTGYADVTRKVVEQHIL